MNIKSVIIVAIMLSSLFWLGNADRTYNNIGITCYLGQLYPGMPIYFCMNPDGGMDHSWFVYQVQDMNAYYTGGPTITLTAMPKNLKQN